MRVFRLPNFATALGWHRAVSWCVSVAWLCLGAALACTPPPEAMPPPQRQSGEALPVIPLRDAPWNATPPDRVLPLVPGAAAPTELHPAVRRTATLTNRLLDNSRPLDERTDDLLERSRDRMALGGYGLPFSPQARWQMARQAVVFFDTMHPEIASALSPPWAYRSLDADAFKQLAPSAQLGWQEALRLDDLLRILHSGGHIVLLMHNESGRSGELGERVHQRKGWALVAVWMPDQRTLAALDVVELRPGQAVP